MLHTPTTTKPGITNIYKNNMGTSWMGIYMFISRIRHKPMDNNTCNNRYNKMNNIKIQGNHTITYTNYIYNSSYNDYEEVKYQEEKIKQQAFFINSFYGWGQNPFLITNSFLHPRISSSSPPTPVHKSTNRGDIMYGWTLDKNHTWCYLFFSISGFWFQ